MHVNSFIVASDAPLPAPVKITLDYVPARHSDALWSMLAQPRALDQTLLQGGRIVTDARNAAVHDIALAQMIYRRSVVDALPRAILLN